MALETAALMCTGKCCMNVTFVEQCHASLSTSRASGLLDVRNVHEVPPRDTVRGGFGVARTWEAGPKHRREHQSPDDHTIRRSWVVVLTYAGLTTCNSMNQKRRKLVDCGGSTAVPNWS